MSRISYSEDEDFPGQFSLWHANCDRSLRGKLGQTELRVLRDALLEMPDKRLISSLLVDEEGGICAIGAYAKHKGTDLNTFDPEEDTDGVGVQAGMPSLVAWKVVAMNDLVYCDLTPEQRYIKMLNWVEEQVS